MEDLGSQLRWRACMTVDPQPDMTCHQGRDHIVGHSYGAQPADRLRQNWTGRT